MPDPDQRHTKRKESDYLGRESRAIQVLAQCIGDIVGVRSEAYKTLVRASVSDNPLDLHLAQAVFEALDPEIRRRIHARVRELGERRVSSPAEPG